MSEFENNENEYSEPTAAESFQTAQEAFDSTYTEYDPTPQNEGKAFGIVSLVCGIVSLPFICCTYLGLIIAVTSIVFGILSITKKEDAKGMAIAGIICSSVSIVIIVISLIVFASLKSSDYSIMTEQLENVIENL